MKRFYLIILMILTIFVSSCSVTSYSSRRTLDRIDEISYVLSDYYPQLYEYYLEGVLDVTSLKEVTLDDGTLDYRIKYRFIRYYYRDYQEKIDALKVHFPELYEMYATGVIEINSLYKYVEKNTGKIRHHCSYSRIYEYYYRYYPRLGGVHINYRPRPNVRPNNPPRPDPRNHPNVRPNNRPPQGGPGNNSRPNNPPRNSNSNRGRR